MSAGTGYVAPAAPPCAYAPRMTRAAALALRTAGALDVRCAVVITDGPAIGPSATVTEIELNPVSATAFGQTARVFTSYDNDAWPGVYDIDLGTGTLTELRDRLGNVAKDVDAGGATVAAFPWGNASWRDNYVEDTTLTAANTQVGTITNCRIVGATVDLTGKASGAWTDTEIIGGSVSILGASGNVTFTRSRLTGTTVTRQAGAAGNNNLVIADSNLAASTVTQAGGGLALNNVEAKALTLSNVAGSVRTLIITNMVANAATIAQQRTVGPNGDILTGAVITGGSSLTLTGTTDNALGPIYSGLTIENLSAVTVAIPPAGVGNQLRGVAVGVASTLNVDTGGVMQNCRVGGNATVNTGAFVHTGTVIELAGITTLTAANVSRLKNKAFDDTV